MRIIHSLRIAAAALGVAALYGSAHGVVTPPAGYIYTTRLLSSPTSSCIAAGPGGTFAGIGPGFTANAQAIVLAKESGELRLVAMGFNSISDCAYDPAADVLYVTDNADSGDLPAALTGDTVFAIPSASTASGLSAPSLELLPANSIPTAANVAIDASGDLLVSDAAGAGAGTVVKISGMTSSPFLSGYDFTGGVAVDASTGNVFVAEALATFDSAIHKYTSAGVLIMPDPFAGPSFGFGSIDLAFNSDGRLLASGSGGVTSFHATTGASVAFVTGLTFVSGMTLDPFTERVQVLSSSFSFPPVDEDKSLHRFTPIDRLVAGSKKAESTCLHEIYGIELSGDDAVCADGAACDADGKENDSCLFPLGFCFNVDDPDFSSCDPGSVSEVEISAKPASAALSQAAAAVADALPLAISTCVFSDGYAVPVKITGSGKKDGKAKVKVKSRTADERKDTDVVKLICQPAP